MQNNGINDLPQMTVINPFEIVNNYTCIWTEPEINWGKISLCTISLNIESCVDAAIRLDWPQMKHISISTVGN
jgi:hypothetical protein